MRILIALTAVAALLQPTDPEDVAGRWELLLTDPLAQVHTIELMLEQDGGELTGLAVDQSSDVVTGRIRGDRITFAYEVETPGRGRMRLGYEGRVDGDTMAGGVAFGRIASGTWSAERK